MVILMRWGGKAFYAKRRKAGLCAHCTRKCWRGRATCRTCTLNARHRQKEFIERNPQARRAIVNRSTEKLRTKVFIAYGNVCACCGITHRPYLTLDHKEGGGNEHRRMLGGNNLTLYRWIIKHRYPKSFQLLCANCHIAKSYNRPCPSGHRYNQGSTSLSITHLFANTSGSPTNLNPSGVRHRATATYIDPGLPKNRPR